VSRDPISLVLRLMSAPAAAGRLVGQAEVVDTGEVVTLRSSADFVALVQLLASREDS